MKRNKILVTGAAGCIGSNLVRRLVRSGKNVNILIKKGTWHPFLDGLDVNVFYGDIRNKVDVRRAMVGCDYVYQVAGVVSYNLIDNKDMFTTHVDGVKIVLDVANELEVEKVVVTASTAGVGIPDDKMAPLNEDSLFDFKKYKKVIYMYSKHLTIKICKDFSKKGLNVCVVSPTTVYGHGDISMHIGKVIKKIKEGKMKVAPPGGNAVVSVDDIVDAHILAMEKGRSGENYIFADEFISYKEMFNRISDILGSKKVSKVYPSFILGPTRFLLGLFERVLIIFGKKPILSPHSLNFTFKFRYFDSSKARQELGWIPKVNFEESIRNAISFYRDNNLL